MCSLAVTSIINYDSPSYLAPSTAGFLLLICKRENGRTTGQKRGPNTNATQEIKSFLDVEVSFQKRWNQTTNTIEAIKK